MIITQEQLHRAILTYAEEEIASKSNGLMRFASYFLISNLYDHPEKTVGALINNDFIKMTGIVNPDGTINVDDLYKSARSAMDKSVSVTISGITFKSPDVDRIYSIIQRG
jgi:hypothetical protein